MTLFYEEVIFNSEVEVTIKYLRSCGVVNSFKQIGKSQAFILENEYGHDL